MKFTDVPICVKDNEKFRLYIGVGGVFSFAAIDFYQDINEAPKFNVDPIHLYISKVLDKDFNEIENEHPRPDDKFNSSIFDFNRRFGGTLWLRLSESLEQMVCNHFSDSEYDVDSMERLDAKLKEYYDGYLEIVSTKEPSIIYEKSGIVIDGEPLYRRRVSYEAE